MTRSKKSVLRSRHARAWDAIADDLYAARRALATAFEATNAQALHGVVSSAHSPRRITSRATASANAAVNALVAWEQAIRNEAARVERADLAGLLGSDDE